MEDVHLLIQAPVSGDLWAYLRVDEEVRRVMLFRKKIFEASAVADDTLAQLRFDGAISKWWTGEFPDLPGEPDGHIPNWNDVELFGVAFEAPADPVDDFSMLNEGVAITKDGFFLYGEESPTGGTVETGLIPWSVLYLPKAQTHGKVIQLFDPAR